MAIAKPVPKRHSVRDLYMPSQTMDGTAACCGNHQVPAIVHVSATEYHIRPTMGRFNNTFENARTAYIKSATRFSTVSNFSSALYNHPTTLTPDLSAVVVQRSALSTPYPPNYTEVFQDSTSHTNGLYRPLRNSRILV